MKRAALAAVLVLAGCTSAPTVQGAPSTTAAPSTARVVGLPTPPVFATVTHSATPKPSVKPPASAAPTGMRASTWPVPDGRLTPGAVKAGCTYPVTAARTVTAAVKAAVRAEYHYSGPTDILHSEIDHRIPHALCGTDGIGNLWVELPESGLHQTAYTHNEKDRLESLLATYVRTGRMTLAAAQQVFRGDWRVGFCRFIRDATVTCDV